jgi:hypothetical protein
MEHAVGWPMKRWTAPSRFNARKLIRHTPLKAIHWANLTHDQITLTTIQP